MVDVSAIIVTRSTCALTRAAVQSVVESSDAHAVELTVLDNGSTDDTAEVLRRAFPAMRLIRAERNLGFARAVNLAAAQATGEFLLLLNSDSRLAPDALGRAVAWLRANPGWAVAGAQLLNPDGSRQNSIANFPGLATELLNKSLLRRLWRRRFPGKEQEFRQPVDVDTVVGAFMLIRKAVWDELGGLDERFFFFFEETDFCLRAKHRGHRVVHLPDVQVWHGQGQTARQFLAGARIEYWRSRYAYFSKNHSSFAVWVLTLGLLARLTVDWLAALVIVVLTAGRSGRWRSRAQVCTALAAWHLQGKPDGEGLPR